MGVGSFWSPSPLTYRTATERRSSCAFPAAPSPSRQGFCRPGLCGRRACECHLDHDRDRQETARSGRVRGSPEEVGGREILCLDQPQSTALERSRGNPRLRQSLPLCRFPHAPDAPIGPTLMSFGPDSKALFGALAASARDGRGALVINISSDAAIKAYSGWGAYGASKAALRHLTAIWDEEARAERVHFLSIDPGDMDTPLHAVAVPDADRSTLKRPEHSAAEIVETILAALSSQAPRVVGRHP